MIGGTEPRHQTSCKLYKIALHHRMQHDVAATVAPSSVANGRVRTVGAYVWRIGMDGDDSKREPQALAMDTCAIDERALCRLCATHADRHAKRMACVLRRFEAIVLVFVDGLSKRCRQRSDQACKVRRVNLHIGVVSAQGRLIRSQQHENMTLNLRSPSQARRACP